MKPGQLIVGCVSLNRPAPLAAGASSPDAGTTPADKEARRKKRGSSASGRALSGREQQKKWAQANMDAAYGEGAAEAGLFDPSEEPTPFPHAGSATVSVSVSLLPEAPALGQSSRRDSTASVQPRRTRVWLGRTRRRCASCRRSW